MLWNKNFDWSVAPFHFVEVFSGDGQCARAWLLVLAWHACLRDAARKRAGFNVASIDIVRGGKGHNFNCSSGFLPSP